MTIQIRKNVFETNSSSSHSLTIAKGDLAEMPFSLERLRSGVVDVSLGEYGWEWKRYYKTDEKIAYLLTQITDGTLPDYGNKMSIMRELCKESPDVKMLVEVVRENSGCELFVLPGSGCIDHQSSRSESAVGMEIFNDKAKLTDFLFNPKSYIETGNDNSDPPWLIDTDSSREPILYFQENMASIPENYSLVKMFSLSDHNDPERPNFGFATEYGGVITTTSNPELLASVIKEGVVDHVRWETSGYYKIESDKELVVSANSVAASVDGGGLKISPNLSADVVVVGGENDGSFMRAQYFVQLPPHLVEQISKLDPTKHREHQIESAMFDYKEIMANWKDRDISSYNQEKLDGKLNVIKNLAGKDALEEFLNSLEDNSKPSKPKKSKKTAP